MQRVPNVERSQLDEQGQAAYDRIAATRGSVRGPFGVLLHHPALGERVGEVGEFIRFHGVLPGSIRELAILVVARELGAGVEWAGHAPLALKEGASQAAVDAIAKKAPSTGLEQTEALVIDAVRALFADKTLSDELYRRVHAAFGVQGVIELTVLAGYYGLLGFVLNTLQVPPPQGAEVPFALAASFDAQSR
jgi:4-carboxymuconolactone decarboxylase